LPAKDKIYFIDRITGQKTEEPIYFESALRFLYGSWFGKLVGWLLANFSLFSTLFGWWQRLSFSKKKILPFIQKYGLEASEFAESLTAYHSFDAFFTRKLKQTARPLALDAIIPADGRYLFYPNVAECDGFIVKGKKFSLETLLGDIQLAALFQFGSMVIGRLAPTDYHRFHFPVDCIPDRARLINGPLFSVNPIALKQKVQLLAENKRMLTSLKTEAYGKILYLEIGATNVGSIHQTYIPNIFHKKGDEKGYFSFGGSSIILLFEPKAIKFADDLVANSLQHMETRCLFGQNLEQRKN
jgi:phosphatidylserine decarboxylase